MRRIVHQIKEHVFFNLCTFLLYMMSPIPWTSPFGAAFLAAAGHGEIKWNHVLIGSALGAILGKGGFGGFAGGLMAYTLSGIFKKRGTVNPKSALSMAAFAGCLFPAYAYHMPFSAYDTIAATFASVIAMAACPAISPIVTRSIKERTYLTPEERTAALFLCAMMLSGLTELYAPLGGLFAGLFALMFSFGGVLSALIGALVSSAGLLMGSAAPSAVALVFMASAAAGAVSGFGVWAQSGMFLIGIPLCAYFGFDSVNACILLASAIFPFLPHSILARILRAFDLASRNTHSFLTAGVYRRHIAPTDENVCGDAGFSEKLPGGHMLFLLADGMGTGENARKMSERAIKNARNLFSAPINRADALMCVNALSINDQENHSTLDGVFVDMITGRAEFFKNGAEPCWVIGRYGVKQLEGGALPVGAVESAPAWIHTEMLSPGDRIFMATDGLINALGGAEKTNMLLHHMKAFAPQSILNGVIRQAKKAPIENRRDDMSAMLIEFSGKTAYPRRVFRMEKKEAMQERKAG